MIAAWLHHLLGLAALFVILAYVSELPFWAYLMAAYGALSVLRIRTFLEHQAHNDVPGRTVIIEDRGPLAFLFLNNNLHAVHHKHPSLAWYRLPQRYKDARDLFLQGNHGYWYRSYLSVFRQYLLRAKDQVPHPLMSRPK